MTVRDALNNMSDILLNSIIVVRYQDQAEAEELTISNFTSNKLADLMQKEITCYYISGNSWKILVKK